MSASDPSQQARARIQEIVERLQSDPAFRREVADNPRQALQETGLPSDVLADIAGGFGHEPDVVGYLRPQCSICTITCIKETAECTKSYLV